MNAKRAKRLRREAEASTVGSALRGYVAGRQTIVTRKLDASKGDAKEQRVMHTTFHVHPKTTRAAYLKLKAAA